MHKLVLLRHGHSQWKLDNRFTGWTDVDLTDQGRKEANAAGDLFLKGGFTEFVIFSPEISHFSYLEFCFIPLTPQF